MAKVATKTKTTKTEPTMVIRSRVSEKAAWLAGQVKSPVYTFEVGPRATKIQIRQAVAKQYKVKVVRVNIINAAGKQIFLGGKPGRRPGLKKAMVYLQAGDKIEVK